MESKANKFNIQFRVSEDDFTLLSDAAKYRSLSVAQTAKIVMLEALSGFDQKHEIYLLRLDKLGETMELLIDISALGAAAGALPWDADQQDGAMLREKLKKHINNSRDLGKNIVISMKNGDI